MKSKVSKGKFFGWLFWDIFSSIYASFVWGFVLQKAYQWFIEPNGITDIRFTYFQFVAIWVVVRLLVSNKITADATYARDTDTKAVDERRLTQKGLIIVLPWLHLFMLWVVYLLFILVK